MTPVLYVAIRKEDWDVNSYAVVAKSVEEAAIIATAKWHKDFEPKEFKSRGMADVFSESTYPDH
jgi:hypothetical protein